MKTYLIKNARLVNEGRVIASDVLVRDGRIAKIASDISDAAAVLIDAQGNYLMPGAIDDQVHFREPGLTHKGELYTESRAAVAGGITSYMEMPNTVPNTLTQELLEDKYKLAERRSLANYSFFMGASNENLDEVRRTDPKNVCGVKVFMGSSTGNMLVDNAKTLEGIFAESPILVATHCEDEATIRRNMDLFNKRYSDSILPMFHPLIRSAQACYRSSSLAVELAKKHNSRLHILHISTAKELDLFRNDIPLAEKRITSEACIHHLWFYDEDYERLGNWIKWNPAVKTEHDRNAIRAALLDGRIDIVATDHAPHTMEEKQRPYNSAPSGGPLVQHAVVAMAELVHQGVLTIEQMVEKMCHAPAVCFQVAERGYIREGYHADLVLLNMNSPWQVQKDNILYKCGWSPFEGQVFQSAVTHTFVSGHLAYANGHFDDSILGQRLQFTR